jgi:hypothetical protein
MGLSWFTNRTYTNFVLRGEWLQEGAESDSGIFLRFPNPGNDPWVAVRQGHEVEIGETSPAKPQEATGSIYPFHAPSNVTIEPFGKWNRYEITCVGRNYAVTLNDRLVNTWTDDKGRHFSGYIGLQNYPYRAAVRHRNLRIKDLP